MKLEVSLEDKLNYFEQGTDTVKWSIQENILKNPSPFTFTT